MGTAVTDERRPERRAAERHTLLEQHAILGVRVRPGYEVALLDISASGVFVQGVHRLLPGTSIELQLLTLDQRIAIRGSVVRCAVSRLRPSAIWYEGAVAFHGHLSLLARQGCGYRVHAAHPPSDPPGRAAASHPAPGPR